MNSLHALRLVGMTCLISSRSAVKRSTRAVAVFAQPPAAAPAPAATPTSVAVLAQAAAPAAAAKPASSKPDFPGSSLLSDPAPVLDFWVGGRPRTGISNGDQSNYKTNPAPSLPRKVGLADLLKKHR